jgi:formylglycine-generating enzyme required for sulfatase activity
VGKFEVTRGQYAAFVRQTGRDGNGCYIFDGKNWDQDASMSWEKPGFLQTDRDPVVCVNWDDAKAYVGWLGRKTGERYRLLSEAEWEYMARAGAATARYWGDASSEACGFANVHDATSKRRNGFSWPAHGCDDRHAKTAPVGSFAANRFGLHDVLGNVWEWVEDCWNKSYANAPTDGSAWNSGECGRRVLRGGSWYNEPRGVRSAIRDRVGTGSRSGISGFRIARTLI